MTNEELYQQYLSGDTEAFAEKAGFFMGTGLQGAVERVDIEEY